MAERYRLLLVDDVALMRGIAKNYFNQSEFQISTARGGQEALRMAAAIRPHLVIVDADMPEMDGIECCRRIKNDPDLFTTPVILLTDADKEKVDYGWSSGCDGLLTRPLRRKELLTAAREYVALANRAAPRVDRNLLVKYSNGAGEWNDYAHNLGTGGLFLATERGFATDERFEVEFLIPRGEKPTRSAVRVAWINDKERPKRPDMPAGVGLEFIDLDRSDRLQLQQFVLNATRIALESRTG